MKASIYNTFFFHENSFVGYNALQDKFIILVQELYELYNAAIIEKNIPRLKEIHNNFYNHLVENGFIISEEINELEEVKKIVRKNDLENEEFYQLTINPTMNCNFKCWYCYESHIKDSILKSDIIERICKHMDYLCSNNPNLQVFHLAWFGGEPLLYFEQTVEPILKYAKKRFENITFFSSITTNGLLIDEFKIKIFKENKLQYFQITLDGYIEEHDSIRYISKKRGSYNIIIENIVMLAKNGLDVNVRINFTRTTLDNIEKVADFFKDFPREVLSKITFDFHQVWQDEDDLEDLLELKIEYFKKYNLISTSRDEIDSFKSPCYADTKNHATINYNGEVFKCTARDFASAIKEGDLLDDGLIEWNEKYNKRLESKIKNKPCFTCKILPICGGGCSQISMENEGKEYCVKNFDENRKLQLVKNRFLNLVSTQ